MSTHPLDDQHVYPKGYENADFASGEYGMTLRQYAAIQLRVPNSGIPELDEMICDSLRNEYAGVVLNGLWSTMTEDMAKGFNDAGVGLPEVAFTQASLMVARAQNGGAS
ncbi:MAG: hypothetical protein ACX94C_07910 [Phycisphaerales bacterium]